MVKSRNSKKIIKKILMIILGTFLYSAGIGLFLDPNELAPGGIVGVSVIISHVFGGETGTWYFLLNIPIIILGWWKFGGKFIIYSFLAITLNSVFTNLFSIFPSVTDQRFLAAIAGSLLVGTGIGSILKIGATTGGVDIIIKILRKKYPFLKTSTLFWVFDVFVVVLTGIAFQEFDAAMYSFITVTLNGKVLDYVLYGKDEARLVYIVSNQTKTLLKRILEEVEIGATILEGKGAYCKDNKEIIMCVIKKRRAPLLEEIVRQEDDHAFMIVSSANEIYGRGYKNINIEKV